MITVHNLNNIEINGTTWSVADAFRNLPDLTAEIYDALIAWESGLADRALATQTAVVEEQAKHHSAQVNDIKTELNAVKADFHKAQSLIEQLTGNIAEARKVMQAQIEETAMLRKQAEFHSGRANKAMELISHMMNGDEPATVAAVRELKRLELAREQAALAAAAQILQVGSEQPA